MAVEGAVLIVEASVVEAEVIEADLEAVEVIEAAGFEVAIEEDFEADLRVKRAELSVKKFEDEARELLFELEDDWEEMLAVHRETGREARGREYTLEIRHLIFLARRIHRLCYYKRYLV